MSEPILFQTTVKAEDAHRYPDMRLRLLLRQSWLNATEHNELTLDEVLTILEDEKTYLEARMRSAN
jgi:hypothetical protein